MADLRALITELANELDHYCQCLLDNRRVTHPLADKARAAAWLAENPPSQSPVTAEGEVAELVKWLRSLEDASVWFESGSPEALKLTRAADLFEQRQGGAEESSVAAPKAEGPTDEELLEAVKAGVDSFPPRHPEALNLSVVEYQVELEIRKARAVLARWGK